jgi:hypothetical protein
MTSRPSTAAPILAVLALVLVTLGAYVGGYFWLAEGYMYFPYAVDPRNEPAILMARCYPHRWQCVLFLPAAEVESWLRGYKIDVEHGAP